MKIPASKEKAIKKSDLSEDSLLESDLAAREEIFDFWRYEDAPEIIAKAGGSGGSFATGFSRIDKLLGGIGQGELIIITAPTGVGKTTLAQSFTWRMAHNAVPTLWFTLEVSLANFLRPFVSHDPEAVFSKGTRYDLATSVTGLQKVGKQPIYFPKNLEQVSWRTLKAMIWSAATELNVGAVFIDHLHYLVRLHERGPVMENMSLYIGDRLRELRRVAIETKTTIFLVAHMTKTPDGKRPTLNDLRDSSFVAQEADAVLVLWRDRLKNPVIREIDGEKFEDPWSKYTGVAIEKARRTGARGELMLSWDRGLYTEASLEEINTYYGLFPKV